MTQNKFAATRQSLKTKNGSVDYFSINQLEREGFAAVSSLPFSIKVLLESILRNCNGIDVMEEDVHQLANWQAKKPEEAEIPFKPARVILQDFTGVPALVDLAAMRSAMKRMGGDARKIEPLIPAELVVDHSLQVDYYGHNDALKKNMEIEFQRNRERYEFLKWGQDAFKTFRVIPPGVGIIHQVNLEYFARAVFTQTSDGRTIAFPDSLVGTDSHTTMINGLGIVGWGVGGIEAEAVMLGQPLYMLMPEVIGFRLTGEPPAGTTPTDIALTVTQMLRKKGVVGKFVEFFGSGLSQIALADRALIANMAPEYGATMGFFPIDQESLRYLSHTGRSVELVELVERYTKEQGLFRSDDTANPIFTDTLELDLSAIEPSLAGPKRPQDRVPLNEVKPSFVKSLSAPTDQRGFDLPARDLSKNVPLKMDGKDFQLAHGAVVIASITSCTNTSNPTVMLAAGLLAKKAVEKGLTVPAYVKTSLAPGSRVVTDYLERTGLLPYLEKLGFQVVGYGCTVCIGNSGPLPEAVAASIRSNDLVAAAVLSGNRNFEGRVNPLTRANYLASPPLVVAYALAGTMNLDLTAEPLGYDSTGQAVYLRDIWPSPEELRAALKKSDDPGAFARLYQDVNSFNPEWNQIKVAKGELYDWQAESTYIQEPPFFRDLSAEPAPIRSIEVARVLAVLGDSVTTDHISPAGSIPAESPAGKYLIGLGIGQKEFNSYGARRGNDRVMVRGTFGNIRLKNLLLPGVEGGLTLHLPDGERMWIYDAAMRYAAEKRPLIILAGKEYGTGSSRDWAAKGTALLGVRAVIAESFERIHRSNLVGMGILPLQYLPGDSTQSLGLTGHEAYTIRIDDSLKPRQQLQVIARMDDNSEIVFNTLLRIDTPVEITYYRNGGILQTVLRQMLK